jgi:branched-chain amino acid transport system substrate-binding protein
MTVSRREFVKVSIAGVAGLATGPFIRPPGGDAQGMIRVGAIYDLSGPLQVFGQSQWNCAKMAIDEINEAGGLLGRKLDVKVYDSQSQMQFYNQYANQMALRDRVAVVQGGLTSASREVIRPILHRLKTLYIYNTNYEGGVCDRNFFSTGSTPGGYVDLLFTEAGTRWGRKVYVLAADYNYGQITAKWIRSAARERGGQVVGEEFFPLDVNQFGPTISKIQGAKPDFVMNVFVGPAHASFYGQWAAAGMNKRIPMVSTTFGAGGEVVRMPTELTDGIMTPGSYYEEIDTPQNRAWLAKFRARFGTDYGYLTDVAVKEWYGWHLWGAAVKEAKSLEREKVIKALEAGLTIEGPGGPLKVDATTHHCYMDMYLSQASGGRFQIQKRFPNVPPTNTGNQCDLRARPDTNVMYEPKI